LSPCQADQLGEDYRASDDPPHTLRKPVEPSHHRIVEIANSDRPPPGGSLNPNRYLVAWTTEIAQADGNNRSGNYAWHKNVDLV
jgi:hypothetical protein